jgi:hypothetical protein
MSESYHLIIDAFKENDLLAKFGKVSESIMEREEKNNRDPLIDFSLHLSGDKDTKCRILANSQPLILKVPFDDIRDFSELNHESTNNDSFIHDSNLLNYESANNDIIIHDKKNMVIQTLDLSSCENFIQTTYSKENNNKDNKNTLSNNLITNNVPNNITNKIINEIKIKNLFVDEINGNDNSDGTRPFKTINAALEKANVGSTIFVHTGKYESIRLKPHVSIIGIGDVYVSEVHSSNNLNVETRIENLIFSQTNTFTSICGYRNVKFYRCRFEAFKIKTTLIVRNSSVEFEDCLFYLRSSENENTGFIFTIGENCQIFVYNCQIILGDNYQISVSKKLRFRGIFSIDHRFLSSGLNNFNNEKSSLYAYGNIIHVNLGPETKFVGIIHQKTSSRTTFTGNGFHIDGTYDHFEVGVSIDGKDDYLNISSNTFEFLNCSPNTHLGGADSHSKLMFLNNCFNTDVSPNLKFKQEFPYYSVTPSGIISNLSTNLNKEKENKNKKLRLISSNETINDDDEFIVVTASHSVILKLPPLQREMHFRIKSLNSLISHQIIPSSDDKINKSSLSFTLLEKAELYGVEKIWYSF